MKRRATAWWQAQVARVDALGLRERILVFLASAVCLGVFANWAWLSPAQDANGLLLQNLKQQDIDLETARTELAATANPVAAQATVRARIDDVQARLATRQETLKALSSASAAQTTPLAQLLAHLLRRHAGLTLLRTDTVSPAVTATGAALPDGLVRREVEMTVAGPYAELIRYIETLEQALPQVRWGAMRLHSEKGALQLTLQLYVIEAGTP